MQSRQGERRADLRKDNARLDYAGKKEEMIEFDMSEEEVIFDSCDTSNGDNEQERHEPGDWANDVAADEQMGDESESGILDIDIDGITYYLCLRRRKRKMQETCQVGPGTMLNV